MQNARLIIICFILTYNEFMKSILNNDIKYDVLFKVFCAFLQGFTRQLLSH